MTTRITISLPDDVADRVDGQLEYGDSRSGWIQQAIEERLEREEATEGNPKPMMSTAD